MQHADIGVWEKFDGSNYKVGIAVSKFNESITSGLLKSALNTLAEYKIRNSRITVAEVAGSVELPVLLQAMAEQKQYDCLVALGAIIRGETAHFEYVAKFVTEGILRVQLDYKLPIAFGVLTCETQEQALARIELGGGYAEAALQSASTIKSLQ
jgi:6,7-dimethyl-8-ribityllumazine synthase